MIWLGLFLVLLSVFLDERIADIKDYYRKNSSVPLDPGQVQTVKKRSIQFRLADLLPVTIFAVGVVFMFPG